MARAEGSDAPRRLAFLVTEDWYFRSHRLGLAQAARDAGWQVAVLTRAGGAFAELEREGFTMVALPWARGRLSPLRELGTLLAIRRFYRTWRPTIVHHVALKPCVLGGLAAKGLPVAVISAVAGLGFTFTATGARARLIRAALVPALRLSFRHPHARVLVQNPDDGAVLARLGAADPPPLVLIRGAGIDLGRFTALAPPDHSAGEPPVIAMVARMIAIKGVRDLVAASDALTGRGVRHRLVLAGSPDPANPSSLSATELAGIAARPWVELRGHVGDVRSVWADADIAVQPSLGGEGLPKSLLEAAACGRPMVATDVPGCREVVRHGTDGVLVRPGDPAALADALGLLIGNPDLRLRMGREARRGVEGDFAARAVQDAHLALYAELAAPLP